MSVKTQQAKKLIQEKLDELGVLLKDSGFDYNIRGEISSSPTVWDRDGTDIGVEFYRCNWVSSWC